MEFYFLIAIGVLGVAVVALRILSGPKADECPQCGRTVERGQCQFCGAKVKDGKLVSTGDRRAQFRPEHTWDVDESDMTDHRHSE